MEVALMHLKHDLIYRGLTGTKNFLRAQLLLHRHSKGAYVTHTVRLTEAAIQRLLSLDPRPAPSLLLKHPL